ncbi:MAG: hypothetical protein Q4D21_01830 [Phascolarctobacterium sp.]|nr:hypothetical protein [Phascolarctobacterium sp.]
MDAGTSVDVNKVTADKDAYLKAGTNITNNDVITAGQDAILEAENAVNVEAKIDATRDVIIDAGTTITTYDVITAGNDASLTAINEVLVQETITATGDVEIESTDSSITTLKDVNGKNVSLDAGTYIDVNDITATEDVNLNAGTYIDVKGKITANDDVTITAGDKIIITDIVKTNGDVTIASTGSSIETQKEISGNNVSMDAKTTVDAAAITTVTDVNLKAGESMNTNGAIAAGNDVKLTAGTFLNVLDKIDAHHDVIINAGTEIITQGVITANHDARITAVTKLTNNEEIITGNDTYLNAGTYLDINKKVTSYNDAVLSAANDININDLLSANENIALQAKQGTVYINADILADTDTSDADDGTAYIKAGQDIVIKEDISAPIVCLVAGHDIYEVYDNSAENPSTSGTIATGELIAISTNKLDLGSKWNYLEKVSLLNDNEDDSLTNVITLGNGGDAQLDVNVANLYDQNCEVHGYIQITNYASGQANDVVIHAMAATKDITVTNYEGGIINDDRQTVKDDAFDKIASSDISSYADRLEGNLTAGGNVTLTANGNIVNKGDIKAGENVTLTAKIENAAANIINDGNIDVGNYVEITASGYIENSGKIVATGSSNGENAGKITLRTSNENLNVDSFIVNKGDMTAKDDILVVSESDDVVNSGNFTTTGDSANIKITAGDDLANSGNMTVKTGGYINIIADDNVLNVGKMMTGDGDVDIISWGGTIFNSDAGDIIAIKGDITLLAGGNTGKYISAVKLTKEEIADSTSVIEQFTGYRIVESDTDSINDSIKDGSVYNQGDLFAYNSLVKLVSDSADVYNFDDLSAVNGDTKYEGIAVSIGSIELIAKQGGVYNSKDLIATTIDPEDDAHILIEANDGLANISYNIIADDDITMISHSGSIVNSAVLQSAEGNVLLEAECGNVFNQSIGYDGNEHGGDIVALNGNVSLIAGSKLDTAQEYSPSTFTIDGQSYTINPGTVINNGDILALGDESTITLKAHTGDVYNNDDFTTILKSDGTSDAYVDAEGNSYYQALGGSLAKGNYLIPVKNLVISAENGLVNTSKDLISTEGSISVTAKTGLSNFANNIYAQNDITLRATDGDVITSSVIESISGDINLISDNGNLINKQGGDLVTLGGNVNMNAGAETDNNLYYIGSTSKNISKIENVESYVVTRYYNAGTADNPDWQLITTDTAAPEDLTAVKTIVNYTTSDGNSETLEFSDDVAVFRNGSVVNYGDIIAIDSNGITGEDGSINLSSAHGNVYNYDDFNKSTNSSGISETYLGYDGQSYNVATGNISLTSPEGEVFNSKKLLVALGDVTIAAAKGMDSFGDTIYAGNNINLIATDGDLVNNAKLISIEGDVNLTANNGTVVNMLGGDIIAIGENGNGGSVNLYAGANEAHDPSINYVDTNGNKGSVVISDEQFQAGNIIVANKYYYPDGSTEPKVIDDTFDIKQLSNTEQASIVTILGFITDDGNLVYDNNISVTDSLGNAVQLVDITITTSEGTQTVKGVQKDIEAYRQGDVVNRGDIVALGSEGISIVSEHSNVTNYDNFAKLDGKDAYEIKGEEYFNDDTEYHQTYSGLLAVSDINLHADEGYIYNGQDIRTAGSVNISSEASLTVGINFGDIEAGEDINIHSNENVNIKNTDLTAGNDINLDAGNNLNVDNSGVNAGNDANLSAGNNANISDTDVNAENNASITAGNDANVSDVNVYAGNDASIAAGNDATINGSIYAGNDASIDAGNDATINGSIDAGNDASIKAGNDANVDAAINATNDASIIADNGNANINGTIDVGRDAYIYAGDELDMNATINSANNTSMIADGDIKINGDVTAQDGVITVASENGDISGNGSLTARQDDASTINGSISVTTTYGNVDLTEVDLLAAGIGNGGTITVAVGEGGTASEAQEIELGKIDGNRVVVINENTNSDSSVKLTDTTVSDFLVVEAENGDLGKITRRDDSEGTLNLAITGVNGGTMNSNIDMDMEDDLRFHALNVSNATINTTGTLDIDRLHTTDKIQANGLGFTTVIYGSKLDNTDPSNSVYVDTFSGTGAQFDLNGKDLLGYNYDPKTNAVNAITNSLINSAASGKNHADNSMYLHTFASNYQDSNGLLIFKTPSYYIKNQRFTLEDLSRNEDDNDVLRADNDNPAVDL